MTTRHQELMDKALQCIHLARAINDRHEDPTKMTTEEVGQRKSLLGEAARLRELAEAQKAQDDMETWASKPDGGSPVLAGVAAMGESKAVQSGGSDPMSQANSRLAVQRFAKAMRVGKQSLTLEEKAALVEDATGEILVPHDIATPIFKDLPHLAIFRGANPLIRPTTSDKVDVRSLTAGTAAWGKLEVIGTGSGTAAARDATPGTTTADVISVHDLIGLAKIGVDELQDTDFNLVSLVQTIIGELFAQLEDDAFGNGTGTSQPWGIAMRATQGSPLITQAVTGSTATGPTGDGLRSMQYRMPARLRPGGAYFASTDAAEGISLLKDTTSNYLWVPSMRVGDPDILWGKPFYILESLPAMATSAAAVDASVLFANLNAGYAIVDRQQITMQRLDELFAADGVVGFLFKLRVGGDVIRPKAFVKYLL
jgi:HK97 family phage major capsid protein